MNLSNPQLAYLLARITLGINFLLHGLVRIPKLNEFATGLTKGFEGSLLPLFLVEPLAYAIPFVEALLGISIIFGIASRKSFTASSIFMMLLITGSAFKEDWGAISTQMLYVLFIFFLLKNLKYEVWAFGKKTKNNVDGFSSRG